LPEDDTIMPNGSQNWEYVFAETYGILNQVEKNIEYLTIFHKIVLIPVPA
jgi:hypothetical protein